MVFAHKGPETPSQQNGQVIGLWIHSKGSQLLSEDLLPLLYPKISHYTLFQQRSIKYLIPSHFSQVQTLKIPIYYIHLQF